MEKHTESLLDFLLDHKELDPVSFHMPGHKGSRIYVENGYENFLNGIMDCDITEIPGADNLFQTESVINAVMEKYRELYEVEKSYLLINGSSGGIISAILAAVCHGGKLIMARNCHKSVFNALTLGNIEPIYAKPRIEEEYDVLGEITPFEICRCLDENPDAQAVILPSPNYYGICSDIRAIADEVHKRGKILIVDQAHGAHLKLFSKVLGEAKDYPLAAEEQGADMVINSTHKTLASWTQTAILNVCSKRVNLQILEDKLQTMESSSPSYPLMASLDINAGLLKSKGEELIKEWDKNLNFFYSKAEKIKGLKLMTLPSMDKTKINIDLSAVGCTGLQFEEFLMKKGIFVELVTGYIVMCMTGIGNKTGDYRRLLDALEEISTGPKEELLKGQSDEAKVVEHPEVLTRQLKTAKVPIVKESVYIDQAVGRVCASSVIPYPPGVPIVCPGEIFDKELLEYIKALRAAGEKVIGVDSKNCVLVGK